MDANTFSFSELERRISALHEGPIAVLDRPRWQYWCDLIGGFGVILGLLPGVLIQLLEPKLWMVTMAQTGLWTMILFFAPGVIRNLWAFGRLVRRGKTQDAEQLDSDFVQMGTLQAWLAQIPLQTIERHLRFIQAARSRVGEKLALMGGGLDRFGILPLILAIGVQLKTVMTESLDTPLWLLLPGLFFAITYLIALNGSFMRIRMHLYEIVLTEALARRVPSPS